MKFKCFTPQILAVLSIACLSHHSAHRIQYYATKSNFCKLYKLPEWVQLSLMMRSSKRRADRQIGSMDISRRTEFLSPYSPRTV